MYYGRGMRLFAATLVALTSAAAADPVLSPPGLTPPIAPETQPLPPDFTESYRSQVFGCDAIAMGLVVLAAINAGNDGRSTNTASLLELGLATYLIGGPLVHLLHDRPGTAAGSLGLRVGAPILLGFAFGMLGNSGGDDSGEGAAILGALIGTITALVIDSAVLAKGDDRPTRAHLTAMPIRGGGVSFGVASTF